MKTTKIKGKDYIEVNERLKHFRENYDDWALISEILKLEGDICVIKASVVNPKGVVKATGIAYEQEGSSFINKTSYIENCETSAWGRALGNFGIGIDTSVASAEEVENAINNQLKISKDKIDTIKDKIKQNEIDEKAFKAWLKTKFKVDKIEDILVKDYKKVFKAVNKDES